MDKFSIIIPTLWNSEEIYTTVERATKCELVKEIIIIDNAPEKKRGELAGGKLKMISKGENIYVNEAWNLGVKISKSKKLCICNDDIVFDVERTLKFVSQKGLKNMGILGCIRMEHDTEGKIEIEEIDDFIASGFGVLMFIHKENYEEIPQYVDIWWGDYWLFENVEIKHVLKNIGLKGEYKTSVKNFRYVTEKDTFKKITKMDPYLESKDSILVKKLAYPIYKIKGYIKYFFVYPLKILSGYLKKAIEAIMNIKT